MKFDKDFLVKKGKNTKNIRKSINKEQKVMVEKIKILFFIIKSCSIGKVPSKLLFDDVSII